MGMQVDAAVCGTNLTPFLRDTMLRDGRYRSGRMVQWVRAIALRLTSSIPGTDVAEGDVL